jgi:hypothetical protein
LHFRSQSTFIPIFLNWFSALSVKFTDITWKDRCRRVKFKEARFHITRKAKIQYRRNKHKRRSPVQSSPVPSSNIDTLNPTHVIDKSYWLILASSNYFHSGSLDSHRYDFSVSSHMDFIEFYNAFIHDFSFFSTLSSYSFYNLDSFTFIKDLNRGSSSSPL